MASVADRVAVRDSSSSKSEQNSGGGGDGGGNIILTDEGICSSAVEIREKERGPVIQSV